MPKMNSVENIRFISKGHFLNFKSAKNLQIICPLQNVNKTIQILFQPSLGRRHFEGIFNFSNAKNLKV